MWAVFSTETPLTGHDCDWYCCGDASSYCSLHHKQQLVSCLALKINETVQTSSSVQNVTDEPLWIIDLTVLNSERLHLDKNSPVDGDRIAPDSDNLQLGTVIWRKKVLIGLPRFLNAVHIMVVCIVHSLQYNYSFIVEIVHAKIQETNAVI